MISRDLRLRVAGYVSDLEVVTDSTAFQDFRYILG